MFRISKYLVVVLALLFRLNSFGQNKTIDLSTVGSAKVDSLKLALKNAKHDTSRISTYIELASQIYLSEPDSALALFNKAKILSENNLKTCPPTRPEFSSFKKQLASCLNNIGSIYDSKGDVSKALEYHIGSLKIREEIGDKIGIATALNNISGIYKLKGEIHIALEYLIRSLSIYKEIGDKRGMAYSLNNIGFIYEKQGDIPKALDYYGRSLKVAEEIGEKIGITQSLTNIGNIYRSQGEIAKSLEYYRRSLKLQEEIGDKKGIATSLNIIGYIFKSQGDPDIRSSKEDALRAGIPKALEYYGRSLRIYEEIGDKNGIATSLNNIGAIYYLQGDVSVTSSKEDALRAGIIKALEYFSRSLMIREEIGDKMGIASVLNNIGNIYLKQKNYSKAIEFCSRSLKTSKELGFPENIRNASRDLFKIYKASNNYKLALENYELFIQMRDSINNESTRKASIKNQLKYEYEKQAAADSVAHAKESEIKNVELKRQSAEIRAKKNQQYALFGGLGLVMIFAGFMFNRFKVTQKQKFIIESQKDVVEEQKKLVEEKQKEILDSIHYARRIQMAQIPSEKRVLGMIKKLMKKGF